MELIREWCPGSGREVYVIEGVLNRCPECNKRVAIHMPSQKMHRHKKPVGYYRDIARSIQREVDAFGLTWEEEQDHKPW